MLHRAAPPMRSTSEARRPTEVTRVSTTEDTDRLRAPQGDDEPSAAQSQVRVRAPSSRRRSGRSVPNAKRKDTKVRIDRANVVTLRRLAIDAGPGATMASIVNELVEIASLDADGTAREQTLRRLMLLPRAMLEGDHIVAIERFFAGCHEPPRRAPAVAAVHLGMIVDFVARTAEDGGEANWMLITQLSEVLKRARPRYKLNAVLSLVRVTLRLVEQRPELTAPAASDLIAALGSCSALSAAEQEKFSRLSLDVVENVLRVRSRGGLRERGCAVVAAALSIAADAFRHGGERVGGETEAARLRAIATDYRKADIEKLATRKGVTSGVTSTSR